MGKVRAVMGKLIYLGQAILNLSNIVMYEFHYDCMLPKYGENLRLCKMDTDSFVYDIATDDFYELTSPKMLRLDSTQAAAPAAILFP